MRKKIFIIFIVMLLIFTACTSKPDPMDTADLYMSQWSSGNYDEMYNLLSRESMADIDNEAFIQRYTSIYDAIRLNEIEFIVSDIIEEEERVLLPFSAIFHTNTVSSFEQDYVLALVEEDGEWKIEWSPELIFSQLEGKDKVRLVPATPQRGIIYDRNQNILAGEIDAYTVGARPDRIPDEEEFAEKLSALIGVSKDSIIEKLNQSWVQPEHFVPIKSYPFNTPQSFKDEVYAVEGVIEAPYPEKIRQYPLQEKLAHLTGYVQVIREEQLEEFADRDYRPHDLIGQQGLEAAYEEILAGRRGYRLFTTDADNNEKYSIAESPVKDGLSITLTIDSNLQEKAFNVMDGYKGSMIVLQPETGEILAMVSQPAFDPNVFSFPLSTEAWEEIRDNPDNVLMNRSTQGKYPPGSAIKPFTAALALSEGVITPETIVEEAQNETWQPGPDWGDHVIRRVPHPTGDVNLHSAMVWSDNIFFAWASLQMSGGDFESFFGRLGIGEPLSFPLGVSLSQTKNESTQWSDQLLADTGYGQGEMIITPLEMASLFTAFMNNGDIVAPQLIKYIHEGTEGETIESFDREIRKEKAISEDIIDILLPSMIDVIEDSTGTGYQARVPDLTIAGKTGTAQVGTDKTEEIGWFVAFTPYEANPLLVCIALEVPAGEGSVRLDMARKIFEFYY